MRIPKFLFLTWCLLPFLASAQNDSYALIRRLIPQRANSFVVQQADMHSTHDCFELGSKNGRIILRGNNGVAIASALYYYLTEYCHCQVTWNGTNLKLPAKLPLITKKIRKETPYQYRYYLNYCTFNYSMSWWDWPRWEKEIDWMALHGINMPLAITGEEYTWYKVYKELGFTDDELKGFFTGPSYFSWFWMGNMDSWGGPLPVQWMQDHFDLQKKIVARERALGMKPVLPAFTGHVPAAFRNKFPDARLKATNWKNGFADTYILDSADPMFARIGKLFLQKQTALLGTDHLYSADTFNENEPPSDEPEYLSKLSARVYEGMHQADTAAVWVMQGWLFYSDRKFWKEPQTQALLKAVPDDKMIILDLATEIEPVWKRTNAFYGKPWIWNMLNNFGANTNLFGRMDVAAQAPSEAYHDPKSGRMKGIGLTMEGIEQNPVLYELLTANTWRDQPINVNEWLPEYVLNRYGKQNADAFKAWDILRKTVYSVPADMYVRDGAESIIQARPTTDSTAHWARTSLNYHAKGLLPAWQAMIKASGDLSASDGFRFDLVDLTRQVLANYALPLQRKFVLAYQQKDLAGFKKYSTEFIDLITDMDKLLATRNDFLLGRWVADARRCGKTGAEKNLYEMNAKDLITLWGDKDCPLNEYACRQWSGLFNDFYKSRWEQFFGLLTLDITGKKPFDKDAFAGQIRNWEWQWANTRKDYPVKPQGDAIQEARRLYRKYGDKVNTTP
ncbi:alpha-N-acetylglucosaminidase [Mucilaginibacter sp. PPCGB 2223]|uniref:alpha-N-acetylglucosaminidase n=1 Tax=Mucilaginibacter sp. PPCGB 2223 TaxID=1886027 RepID=UPI0008258F8B|nr:alpha-N-acetylglucosaminidase [Mucilaginibacter sp. PPCGB 2223]OCX52284.1 alpha-N-acetylglucosaminidase [Mucilaginibacter sp. PPCGB 2223]